MAHQIPVPAEVTNLDLMTEIDYQDAFAVDTPLKRTPDQWVRTILAAAPTGLWPTVRQAQRLLGANLHTADHDHPLGWNILRNDDTCFVLGVDGGAIESARIVGIQLDRQVAVATQIQFGSPRGRLLWIALAPVHRRVAQLMLDRGLEALLDASSAGTDRA